MFLCLSSHFIYKFPENSFLYDSLYIKKIEFIWLFEKKQILLHTDITINMKRFIANIQVNQLFHLHDFNIPIADDNKPHLFITGKNGSGKNVLLRAPSSPAVAERYNAPINKDIPEYSVCCNHPFAFCT